MADNNNISQRGKDHITLEICLSWKPHTVRSRCFYNVSWVQNGFWIRASHSLITMLLLQHTFGKSARRINMHYVFIVYPYIPSKHCPPSRERKVNMRELPSWGITSNASPKIKLQDILGVLCYIKHIALHQLSHRIVPSTSMPFPFSKGSQRAVRQKKRVAWKITLHFFSRQCKALPWGSHSSDQKTLGKLFKGRRIYFTSFP